MSQPFQFPRRWPDRLATPLAFAERLSRRAARVLLRRGGWKEGGGGGPEPAHATPPPAARGLHAREASASAVIYLPALPWAYRFQRPQQLATALAALGEAVLYVEVFDRSRFQPRRALHRLGPDLYRLSLRLPGRPDPFREPFPSCRAQELAREIVDGIARPARMVLVQLPFWEPLGTALSHELGCPLVYDRIDLHTGFAGVPPAVAEVERALVERADLVSVTSRSLADGVADAGRRTILLPNAVALHDFGDHPAPPRETGGRVRVGYVGALGDWFDVEAVRSAAIAEPGWRFVLAGAVESPKVAALGHLPNLDLLGEIPYRTVPTFLRSLDVALVPFRDLPLTRAVDPVKLYETFAAGVPVVARRLPEVERWPEPLLYPYEAPTDLAREIRRAVGGDTLAIRRRRRGAVEGETWTARAATLLRAIDAGEDV